MDVDVLLRDAAPVAAVAFLSEPTLVSKRVAAFFWIVWLFGDADRYLGERTQWVVPFGAVAIAIAFIGLLIHPRSADRPLQPREGAGMLVLLAPILFVLAVPGADLGASAAERRVMKPKVAAQRLKARGPIVKLSYAHIMAADGYPQPGVVPGVRVQLTGFAMRKRGTPEGLFQVTRFELNCCIGRRDRAQRHRRPAGRDPGRRPVARRHRPARAARQRADRRRASA